VSPKKASWRTPGSGRTIPPVDKPPESRSGLDGRRSTSCV
jgi:hypothetical protein